MTELRGSESVNFKQIMNENADGNIKYGDIRNKNLLDENGLILLLKMVQLLLYLLEEMDRC